MTAELRQLADKISIAEGEQLTAIGRELFMRENYAFRPLFEVLIADKEYDKLVSLLGASPINKEDLKLDYITSRSDMKLAERYFDIFMKIADSEGMNVESLLPVLLYCLSAPTAAPARQWKKPAYRVFLNLAYADYDKAWGYLSDEPSVCGCEILLEADKTQTCERLLYKLLYGTGDKRALRKFFFKNKIDIFVPLKDAYKKGNAREREAVARLACLYRNDPRFSALIEEMLAGEKSKTVLAALSKRPTEKEKAEDLYSGEKDRKRWFCALMREGKEFDVQSFTRAVLEDKQNTAIASTLFFTVSEGLRPIDIVVVDNGALNGLDNMPYVMPSNCTIRVSHPTDFQGRFSFIPQLNIEQSVEQIKRKFYVPEGEEKNYNFSSRISGSIIQAARFKRNLKQAKMRSLSKDADGVSSAAGLYYDKILAVLFHSPVNLEEGGKTVTAKEIKFFDADKVIRLCGQIYTEGVYPLNLNAIPERVFSEFITAVYEVLERI